MVKAVKRKAEEVAALGLNGLAEGKSLAEMTPKEIKLMNAEFAIVASNKLLAERAIKVGFAAPYAQRPSLLLTEVQNARAHTHTVENLHAHRRFPSLSHTHT